ncbi:hypothetical protein J6590_090914 [Homalodisca vitripennis]|nr:hypothetical protein J6590_090914 [Homalodisca vitripennis]
MFKALRLPPKVRRLRESPPNQRPSVHRDSLGSYRSEPLGLLTVTIGPSEDEQYSSQAGAQTTREAEHI